VHTKKRHVLTNLAARCVGDCEKMRHVLGLNVATALVYISGRGWLSPGLGNVPFVDEVHIFVARVFEQCELALRPVDRRPGFDPRAILVLLPARRVVRVDLGADPAQPNSVRERSIDIAFASAGRVHDKRKVAVCAASIVWKPDELDWKVVRKRGSEEVTKRKR
jgi:hypothetical protein